MRSRDEGDSLYASILRQRSMRTEARGIGTSRQGCAVGLKFLQKTLDATAPSGLNVPFISFDIKKVLLASQADTHYFPRGHALPLIFYKTSCLFLRGGARHPKC